jgi:SAM-dependent methyltransferase
MGHAYTQAAALSPPIRGCGARPFGVDLDPSATEAAVRQDPGRQSVLRGNGCQLPFPDGLFSLVTSFETIEHLHARKALVAELRRVLAPDGVFILSTPNANHTRPVNGKPDNPFHVHEYTPDELKRHPGTP